MNQPPNENGSELKLQKQAGYCHGLRLAFQSLFCEEPADVTDWPSYSCGFA